MIGSSPAKTDKKGLLVDVKNSLDLNKIVDGIFKKGEKTLLLTIINNNNRRRYIGVKIN